MDREQSEIRREVVLAYARYLREYAREVRERAVVTRDWAGREFSYGLSLYRRAAQLRVRLSDVEGRRTPPRPALSGGLIGRGREDRAQSRAPSDRGR
jgi:hypothetical protein